MDNIPPGAEAAGLAVRRPSAWRGSPEGFVGAARRFNPVRAGWSKPPKRVQQAGGSRIRQAQGRSMKAIQFPLAVLSTGYILFFYSELVFWARPRAEDTLANWLLTWLAYCLAGWAFLSTAAGFRARSAWAVFLCGAIFGWLTEGVIVQTMYEGFPLQISWTGLAWHALISVMAGWYGMRLALRRRQLWPALGAATGLGLFWGLWAIWWWVEHPDQIASLGEFAGYALVASLLLAGAYWLCDRLAGVRFEPKWWSAGVLSLVFAGLFIFGAIPAALQAALILPPLLGATFLALAHNRRAEAPGSPVDAPGGRARLVNILCVLAMPLAAIAVYAAALSLNLRLPTGWVVYAITTPAGFVLFIISLVKTWRVEQRKAPD